MDPQKIAKEVLELNKSVLDNTFNAISTVQDQSAKMFTSVIDEANWLPDEGKKIIIDWVSAYQRGRNDFKAVTDEKYKSFTNYFAKQDSTGASGMNM